MKVQCSINQVSKIPDVDQDHVRNSIHLDEVDLEIGRNYDVFGLAFRDGRPWFYVLEDENDVTSLRPYFSGFFKIVDKNIGRDWEYCSEGHSEHGIAILPAKWASYQGAYESLIEGNDEAVALFDQLYKYIAAAR